LFFPWFWFSSLLFLFALVLFSFCFFIFFVKPYILCVFCQTLYSLCCWTHKSSSSGFNYKLCIGNEYKYLSRYKQQIILGQIWRSHKIQLIFYGYFNFLNIYITTKYKWDFILDASTNSTHTITKYKLFK
jgi:hypothetical protein